MLPAIEEIAMTYKTILVHVGPDPEAENRLTTALTLGQLFDATIFGVGAIAWDPYVDPALGYVDGAAIEALRLDVENDLAAAKALFDRLTAGYARPSFWRTVRDYPGATVSALSRCADLILASPEAKGFGSERVAAPADLVMRSGPPVLLLPPGTTELTPRRVLIGWNNTREARRAVSDAIPLLKAAEEVAVVQIAEGGDAGDDATLRDVVNRLDRHGIEAEASIAPRLKLSVPEELMGLASSRNADVVVLGAYGHSRLREWAFGGVTAELIQSPRRPIFFGR
jgi:nucleotide-binding universal stress UspA family protein